MFESITFESIIKRMLSKIPSDMDKREGSIIYDALAPVALELQLMYIELDNILGETFADSASRAYLIRRVSERGLEPSPATHAILKGEFNMEVPIGSRFSLGELNYIVLDKIDGFSYQMKCESSGVAGNRNFGEMVPVNYIKGLSKAMITELLIPAEDEEETEVLRARYFDSFNNKAFGGNITDYLQKTNAISGVGSVKVTPAWNGGGTVKLTLLDSTFGKATDTLIETVQEEIDPTQDGSGLGVAPIGHIVTVDTVDEVNIDIETSITFDTGYDFGGLEDSINEVVEDYLLEERKKWGSQGFLIIRLAYIEARILAIDGVLDIKDTKINGVSENLVLESLEIPILRGVSNV